MTISDKMMLLGRFSLEGLTISSPNVTKLAVATVIGSTVIAFTSVFGYHCMLSRRRTKEPPVRWSWLPFLGHALELGNHPLELLTDCAKKYGEIFGLVVAGNRMFIISDPHSYNLIMSRNKDLSIEEFHNSVMINFFGASRATMTSHVLNDDVMRAWFSKYLFSDNSLQNITVRMQKSLKLMMSRIPILSTNTSSTISTTTTNEHQEEGEEGILVSMYDFLGKFVFDAAVSSLFNDEAGNDPDLYPAFVAFDNFLPMAVAGISVNNVKHARNVRDVLMKAVAMYKENTCELIEKRWEHFNGMYVYV